MSKHQTIISNHDFDFKHCHWFLDRGHDEIMHQVLPNSVRKAITVNGDELLLEVWGIENGISYKVLNKEEFDAISVENYLKNWLDIDRNIEHFYNLLNQDSEFNFLAKNFKGLKLITIDTLFESLVWSIIGQQINLKFAYQMKRDLVELTGHYLVYDHRKYYFFPSPKHILDITDNQWGIMRFSRQKIQYIKGMAHEFLNGNISEEKLMQIQGLKNKLNFLVNFKGIGSWTAHYCLMKFAKEMNAVPFGDAGINQALHILKGIPKKGSLNTQESIYESFEDYKAYLTLYMWHWLSNRSNSDL